MPSLALLAHLHIPSASFLLFAPPSSSLPWLKKNPSLSLFFFWPVSLSFTSLCLPRSPLAVPYLALPCLHFLLWHLLCLSGRLPLSGSPLSLCPPVSLPLSVSELLLLLHPPSLCHSTSLFVFLHLPHDWWLARQGQHVPRSHYPAKVMRPCMGRRSLGAWPLRPPVHVVEGGEA